MRTELKLVLGVLVGLSLAACSSGGRAEPGRFPLPDRIPGDPGGVVVVNDEARHGAHGPRGLKIPPGHYPPPGECRLWYPGRPPGHQPPPTSCNQLRGRVPHGAFILYNDKAWDSNYDWGEHERHNRGTVPAIILELVRSASQ